jgi:succinate dehydrogenase / fumarate reductase iron-sulfur subunit
MTSYQIQVTRSAEGGIATGQQRFTVLMEDRMTVLDALIHIQREQDSTLSFRCACRVGMCGTCAMSIDGVPRLACKTRVKTLATNDISVAPLPNLPVVKDLVVSMKPFFDQWRKIKPAFRPSDSASRELAVIPQDSAFARAITRKRDCITCGACFAACGVKTTSGEYIGPAAINKAFLRIMDPRDGAAHDRVEQLNQERSGVWRCHTQFNCTSVCPKHISLTETIATLKRALLFPERLIRK